jgi:hypothetical protein
MAKHKRIVACEGDAVTHTEDNRIPQIHGYCEKRQRELPLKNGSRS